VILGVTYDKAIIFITHNVTNENLNDFDEIVTIPKV
jgi:hypothetical protein